MHVNVVCRNWQADRVLPRFARYLADGLGWTLTPKPVAADVHYLMGYFEVQMCDGWPRNPVASLFTHREEEPPGNAKALLYDSVASRVSLRVAMCRRYATPLQAIGPTFQPPLPVERDRFVIVDRKRSQRPVVGVAGFSTPNSRKGEALVGLLRRSGSCPSVEWSASGRGPDPRRGDFDWPKATRYSWQQMPRFYAGLDVLLCPSLVEGGPMTVLEALSSGVPVVIPREVGILDELPETRGIYRYQRGDVEGMAGALKAALAGLGTVDREALRATTAAYTVRGWCEAHAAAFAQVFEAAA